MKLAIAMLAFGLVAVSQGRPGVGILSLQEEDEALQLFQKLCAGGRSEGGDLGGARVWCKFGPGETVEIVNHNVEVPAPIIPDSVVFVQPPPVVYKHNVAVQGTTGTAPRTKIYVLPQKSSHSITSQYNPGSVVTTKPTVYFLKSSGASGADQAAGGYRYPPPPGAAGYA